MMMTHSIMCLFNVVFFFSFLIDGLKKRRSVLYNKIL